MMSKKLYLIGFVLATFVFSVFSNVYSYSIAYEDGFLDGSVAESKNYKAAESAILEAHQQKIDDAKKANQILKASLFRHKQNINSLEIKIEKEILRTGEKCRPGDTISNDLIQAMENTKTKS